MEKERKYRRLTESLEINYRIITARGSVQTPITDISEGGMRFPVIQKFVPGVFLELDIQLKKKEEPIKAVGEVVWRKDIANPRFPFEVGVKFVKISLNDKTRIFSYIQNKFSKKSAAEIGWIE